MLQVLIFLSIVLELGDSRLAFGSPVLACTRQATAAQDREAIREAMLLAAL